MKVAAYALDKLLPPQCLHCNSIVELRATLCADCWSRISFIAEPFCQCCGLPFDYDAGPDIFCAHCLAVSPAYDRARSVMRYGDESARIVMALKHGDRHDSVPMFSGWLHRIGQKFLETADIIVPVPLHRRRLFTRRFNQAALLALELSRLSGIEAIPDLLSRTRHTPSQAGLGAADRQRNVRGAFAVRAGHDRSLAGAHVLLVDDVLTTGATVNACAAALRRSGARAIDVVTLARVVRPQAII